MDKDELLQPSLQGDSRMENLARLIAGLSALPVSVPIVNLFDLVDASALASLAEQFHVMGDEGWNLAGTEAARRALLKEAIELHRHKGTRWAVRHALEVVLARSVIVREWFEYEGKPFFFRVRFDVGGGLEENALNEVFRLIYENKNVRSWLEQLETETVIPLPEHVGTGLVGRTTTCSTLWFLEPPPSPLVEHAGVGLAGRTATRPRLWFQPPPPEPVSRWKGAVAAHVTSSRLRTCSSFRPAPIFSMSPGVVVRSITKFRLGVPDSGGRYVR